MRMKMSSVRWRPFFLGLNVLSHYFRWLNAKEANPQCTEAASLVSFALSHPFVICHQLNITLYCASITTAHAFPFRVASMPAVRYDLSGGLPTCLWLFIYQDYSVICISKSLSLSLSLRHSSIQVGISSCNGLAPSMRQIFTWANCDIVQWRMYALQFKVLDFAVISPYSQWTAHNAPVRASYGGNDQSSLI